LKDARGSSIAPERAAQLVIAYKSDGTAVELVPTGLVGVDGTPIDKLRDMKGNPLTGAAAVSDKTAGAPAPVVDVKTETIKTSDGQEAEQKPVAKEDATPGNLTLADLKEAEPKLSGAFHWADRDKNGYISAEEVLYFIDQLFEGDGKLTIEDIQNLIDFYFDQD
jgi:hypothetical protein